jgi:pSer/pThr/pTyr-binding forkhead associated (FHA) protein
MPKKTNKQLHEEIAALKAQVMQLSAIKDSKATIDNYNNSVTSSQSIDQMPYPRLVEQMKDGTIGAGFAIPNVPDAITIGRRKDCDIRIKLSSVSRLQAKVIVNSDGYVELHNISKTNPTYVNDEPIESVVLLRNGDVIAISESKFVFQGNEDLTLNHGNIHQSSSTILEASQENDENIENNVEIANKEVANLDFPHPVILESIIAEVRMRKNTRNAEYLVRFDKLAKSLWAPFSDMSYINAYIPIIMSYCSKFKKLLRYDSKPKVKIKINTLSSKLSRLKESTTMNTDQELLPELPMKSTRTQSSYPNAPINQSLKREVWF